jgi:hypothetical protein
LKTPGWFIAIADFRQGGSIIVLSATGALLVIGDERACTATTANSQLNRTDAKSGV